VPRLQFNDVTFDSDTRQVWCRGREVRLSPKAFELLALLIERRPHAVSKQEIRDRLWPTTFVSDSNLPTLVSEVRDGICDGAREPRILRTLHGFGYAFDDPETGAAAAPSGTATLEPAAWLVGSHTEIELSMGEHVIGREGAGVILVKSTTASRRHLRISIARGSATAEDLGSKNGTYVNEKLLTVPTPLADGDQLRIGSLIFTFRVAQPTATTETQQLPGEHLPRG
jgi:DNA-binding winged helix-turn-helix (wHTH) protein